MTRVVVIMISKKTPGYRNAPVCPVLFYIQIKTDPLIVHLVHRSALVSKLMVTPQNPKHRDMTCTMYFHLVFPSFHPPGFAIGEINHCLRLCLFFSLGY